jgi:hypothetical protein
MQRDEHQDTLRICNELIDSDPSLQMAQQLLATIKLLAEKLPAVDHTAITLSLVALALELDPYAAQWRVNYGRTH